MDNTTRNYRVCRTILMSKGWLTDQPEAFASAMLRDMTVSRYEAGEIVYRQGDVADGLYGIASGQILHYATTPNGDDLVLFTGVAGEWFGERAAMRNMVRPSTAVALTDSLVARVSERNLLNIFSSNPAYFRCIADLATRHLERWISFATEILSQSGRVRLLRILGMLADDLTAPDDSAETVIHITQSHLASLARLSRQSTNIILREFERDGFIELRYRAIIITDRYRLMLDTD